VTDLPISVLQKSPDPLKELWLPSAKLMNVTDIISYFDVDYDVLQKSAVEADDGQVRVGVIEFGGRGFNSTELALFQEEYGVPLNPIRKVIGEVTSKLSVESAIDIQLLTSIAQNLQTWYFGFDGADFMFGSVVDMIMGTPGAPKIFSVSYAVPEVVLGDFSIQLSNTALMKLGLGGYTLTVCAGDTGPVLDPNRCSLFNAEFPASSPYVTSVGGVSINKTSANAQAWMKGGGGFSTFFKQPPFQKQHVQAYLKQNVGMPPNPDGFRYNVLNRAHPDVAAISAYSKVAFNGNFWDVAGTSLAAPEFAALLGMINVYRYQNGLGALGAVNQALYSLENGIGHDIQEGTSYATSRFGCDNQYATGFQAVQGWDPVTGLGTPNFPTLLKGLGHIGSTNSTNTTTN